MWGKKNQLLVKNPRYTNNPKMDKSAKGCSWASQIKRTIEFLSSVLRTDVVVSF